jgi:dTDP-4-amino-4,6-dideoxygalactose transaminase
MLAIRGGHPVRIKSPIKYPWFDGFDNSEILKIIEESNLSGFLASHGKEHLGGAKVRELEEKWCEVYRVGHSVGFNSWTSGLEAAVASCGLPKYGEVITSAWTMSATISSIMHSGLTPRFVDIDLRSFNIDVGEIEKAINSKTVAVMGVDIFGKPCDAPVIREICDRENLIFIVDSAQTPMATIGEKKSIDYAQVGGYSLNRHKHLQVGEGGVAVTNDDLIARRMRLFRNHSEVTAQEFDISVPIGHNLRMGEIEATLAIFQLGKMQSLVEERKNYGRQLVAGLRKFDWIHLDSDANYENHDFYILGLRIDDNFLKRIGGREILSTALKAEGLSELVVSYGNLHNLKAFKDLPRERMTNTEKLSQESFLGIYLCGYRYTQNELDDIVTMFEKIDKHLIHSNS